MTSCTAEIEEARQKKMFVLGVTGRSCSGKTHLCDGILKSKIGQRAVRVDCDQVAHDLYASNNDLRAALERTFGPEILVKNGGVNRQELGRIVFSSGENLKRLNDIVWPFMTEEIKRRLKHLSEDGTTQLVLLDAAVLNLAKWNLLCDRVITMNVGKEVARTRGKLRGWEDAKFETVWEAQSGLPVDGDASVTSREEAEQIVGEWLNKF